MNAIFSNALRAEVQRNAGLRFALCAIAFRRTCRDTSRYYIRQARQHGWTGSVNAALAAIGGAA